MKRKYNTAFVSGSAKRFRKRGRSNLYRPPRFIGPVRPFGYSSNIIKYQQTRPGGEIKSIDIVNSVTPTTNTVQNWNLSSTQRINALNMITIGSSMWNRQGRKITMKSLRLRGYIVATGNNFSVLQTNFARITVFYDKQTNGAAPVASDLFLDQASVATDSSITSPLSGINLNNRERFEVIWDKQLVLPPNNTSTGTASLAGFTATADCMHFDWFINLRNRETHYKADSAPAVIGDIATGSLIMCTQGNIVNGNEPWSLQAAIRLRYSDL